MKILIVAATRMEVEMLAEEFEFEKEINHFLKQYRFKNTEIDILIAGIGTTFTTFHLTNTLKDNNYNWVLNVGLAGSLNGRSAIGQVVNVVSEEFADLGIENNDEFLTLFETGYINSNEFPFEQGILKAAKLNGLSNLSKVRGITTNKSHGRASSIDEIHEKFSAHVESMEGAAVFYVCNMLGVPCSQIRAVSNFVVPREVTKWNIPLAINNLRNSILPFLENFSQQKI